MARVVRVTKRFARTRLSRLHSQDSGGGRILRDAD
jgi:hypothetical protein